MGFFKKLERKLGLNIELNGEFPKIRLGHTACPKHGHTYTFPVMTRYKRDGKWKSATYGPQGEVSECIHCISNLINEGKHKKLLLSATTYKEDGEDLYAEAGEEMDYN